MPVLVRPAQDAILPLHGPTLSYVKIDGKLYSVRTWTEDQWRHTAERDRPEGAGWHGNLIMSIGPA